MQVKCARVIHFIAMPKAKPSKSCHLKQIVAEFGDDVFSTDGDITVRDRKSVV
jgi:hypothetical protein